MARKSFTLRRPIEVGDGTYLQYPSGSEAASAGLAVREDEDTRLKSDGLLLAPILRNPAKSGSLLPYISFFEANVTDYNEITLSWDAPLTDLESVAGIDTVVATSIVIVYSEEGEPQTISDGSVIVNDNRATLYYHTVPSGKWAYYTLFVKFESKAGDLYYEPSAKLAILTPNRYNSVEALYAKIPEHYRLLDGDLDEGIGGPLFRYLSIFGYEIDRVRTAIDHLMVMKDPQVANSEVLDYLSQDLGIGLRVHELGAPRLRNLINIIGYLRRAEGTKSALELTLQALTGSDVEVDAENNNIKVYAQRVNLLKDPDLRVLVAGVLDGGLSSTEGSSYGDEVDAGFYNTTSFESTIDGGSPSATGGTFISAEQDPSWQYEPDPNSGGSVSVLKTYSNPEEETMRPDYIRVKSGDILYFSMQKDPTTDVQDQILRARLMYGGGESIAAVAESSDPIRIAGINYWKLEVEDGYEDYINVYLYVDFPSSIDALDQVGKLLLERSSGGAYFDGSTTLGGWLIDSNTISDYRWYNEEDPDSSIEPDRTDTFSVYNSNYSKTRAVVHRMLSSFLPITELTTGTSPVYPNAEIPDPKWHVTFNHIPGVPYPS